MDKATALKIICNCASLYKKNLINKQFLFVSSNKNTYNCIEVRFQKANYLHLTGLELNNNISASSFYDRCLKQRLSIKDFEFKENGTAELKLSILSQLMNINTIAKMIGNYNNSKPKLYTEKLTGNIHACMGLVKNGDFYYPNTGLKEDIRDLTNQQDRIIAIFSKNLNDKLYFNVTYVAKNIELAKINLSKDILSKIDRNKIIPKEVAIESAISPKEIEILEKSEIETTK